MYASYRAYPDAFDVYDFPCIREEALSFTVYFLLGSNKDQHGPRRAGCHGVEKRVPGTCFYGQHTRQHTHRRLRHVSRPSTVLTLNVLAASLREVTNAKSDNRDIQSNVGETRT